MTSSDMLSINNVAAKLGLSVHQLRRWELMFGLEIKRGRGQQRQYREEDMSVLERIKELVEQGWPTSQIRPQLEAEGLLMPKMIGAPPAPGNPEVLQEALIGLRNFSERRFIDISKQIDELRQLVIAVTLKQELATDKSSPWQPMASEFVPAPKNIPPQEITIGPQISIDPPKSANAPQPMMGIPQNRVNQIPPTPSSTSNTFPGAQAGPSNNTDFSHRSIIGGTPNTGTSSNFAPGGASGSSFDRTIDKPLEKIAGPDLEQAPKPITDALQRSMSTLDSLFKDPRNNIPASTAETGTGSSTQNPSTGTSSLSNAATPPLRHSTIPPLPTAPAAQPAAPPVPPQPSLASSSPPTGSFPLPQTNSAISLNPGQTKNDQEEKPAAASAERTSAADWPAFTSPAKSNTDVSAASFSAEAAKPAAAAPSAWDQAFASTSVDINAVPSSGLFEDTPSPAKADPSNANSFPGIAGNVGGSSSNQSSNASSAPMPAPAPAAEEQNPFTTITGTNYNAVDSKPFDSTITAGQPLNQTGPLPAHTSIESFAPEIKERLIASQSDSTSSELPQLESGSALDEPVISAPVPALPVSTGPQVNFGPNVSAPTPQVTPQRVDDNFGLGEVTDQNYLTVLGRALDLIGWSDEQADSYSLKTFGVPHWDELGRSQAEKLVAHLVSLLKDQLNT